MRIFIQISRKLSQINIQILKAVLIINANISEGCGGCKTVRTVGESEAEIIYGLTLPSLIGY